MVHKTTAISFMSNLRIIERLTPAYKYIKHYHYARIHEKQKGHFGQVRLSTHGRYRSAARHYIQYEYPIHTHGRELTWRWLALPHRWDCWNEALALGWQRSVSTLGTSTFKRFWFCVTVRALGHRTFDWGSEEIRDMKCEKYHDKHAKRAGWVKLCAVFEPKFEGNY